MAGPAGYSGTPLAQKLGIKSHARVIVIGAPWDYARVVGPLPEGVKLSTRLPKRAAFIHCFLSRRAELERRMPQLSAVLEDDGILWLSWPKRVSGVATDLTEDLIRGVALANRLVDVKVCAVDAIWSGLKLVRPVALRGARPTRGAAAG